MNVALCVATYPQSVPKAR